MNDSEVRDLLDSVESADSVEEARQIADSSQHGEGIDQFVELARAHNEGRTTYRSIVEQVGIERESVWRALEVLPGRLGGRLGHCLAVAGGAADASDARNARAARNAGVLSRSY